MRVISTPLKERYTGVMKAAAKVFDVVGLWNPRTKPIFDLFDEIKPDLVFCDIQYVDEAFMRACNEYTDIKIVLFSEALPRDFNPTVVCAIPSLSGLMKKHLEAGANEVLYIHDSADVITFWNQEVSQNLESDIAYWSRGSMASKPLQKMQLFSELSDYGKLKIIGPTKIPLPNYLGTIKEANVMEFLRASKIAIDWNGENILDQAANGIFTISTIANNLFPVTDNESLKEQISSFLGNDRARRKKAKQAQKDVLSSSTCYHRLKSILETLELKEYIKTCDDRIQELQECVQE